MFDRMNRRFAYGFQGGNWQGEQGWTPPWLRDSNEWNGPHFRGSQGQFGPRGRGFRGPFGPREFWMQRGHGPFGPRDPFGPDGSFGPESGPHGHGHGHGPGRGQRFFGRGDMKFALLQLLQERPRHGYEMMKALEERSGGFYAPSAGSIYPTLQMLEDRGLVTSNEADGKKVYSISDAGRAFLKEQGPQEGAPGQQEWRRGPFGRGGRGWSPEMQALKSEAGEVARLLMIAGRTAINNPEQLAKLRTIIESTRKELSAIIYEAESAPKTETTNTSATPNVEEV